MSVTFKADNIAKHKDLSDKIKEALVVEGPTIKESEPHSAYYSNLPEGLSRKEVEEVAKYNSKFVTAAHVAVGELASDVFVKDKDLNEVNASIGFFGKSDNIEINVSRSKTYQNHLASNEEEKEVTKHLVMKTIVTSQSMKGYGLKSIRESMSEEFQNLFSS